MNGSAGRVCDESLGFYTMNLNPVQKAVLHRIWEPISQAWLGRSRTVRVTIVLGAVSLVLYEQITKRLTISRKAIEQRPKWSKFSIEAADNFESTGRRNGVE